MPELPRAPVARLLRRTSLRVSDDAVTEFTTLLEEVAADLAAEATALAKSEGRQTVLAKDVLAARRKLV